MKYLVLALFAFCVFADTPPPKILSQGSGDSSPIVTNIFKFPNFSTTHTGSGASSTAQFNVLSLAGGGTGQTSASNAINALLPSQTGLGGDCLGTNGTVAAWVACLSALPGLTNGDFWVGNSGGVAVAVAPSGDASFTNAGVFTVKALQGVGVSTNPPSTGNVLGYNGSVWLPSVVGLPALTNGDFWVGNGSSLAIAVAPSGDATFSNTGVFTVKALQGTAVSASGPTTNQHLVYNGTAWAPVGLAAADVWVGNSGGVPIAVAPGGDVSMSNAGSFTLQKIQGVSVSAASPSSGNFLEYNGTAWIPTATFSTNISMGSNRLTSVTDPTSAQDAATKNYVDTQLLQLNPAAAVYAASTGNIAGTYTNAVGGVCIGDTFTVTATGALSIDGQSPAVGARVLLKNQSGGSTFQNGVWTVTVAGTTGVSPVLTRATDFDSSVDFNAGQIVPVINGTVNAGSSWYQTATVVTCSSDAQTWTQFQKASSAYLLVSNNLSDVATAATAFNNISPMTTGGDLIYGGSSGAGTRLANGSAGDVLSSQGTTVAPHWITPASANTASAIVKRDSSGNFTAGTITATGLVLNGPSTAEALKLNNAAEVINIVASAPASTTNLYVASGAVQYYTSNAANNWTLNIAWSSGTTFATATATGDAVTVVLLVTQGSTAYYATAINVDGTATGVTTVWQGGTAPTAGNVSGIDAYSCTVIKTAGTPTYEVLCSLTQF